MSLDQHPYIEMRRKRRGVERPVIKGTRMEVAYIVADSEYQGMTPDEIAAGYDHLSLDQVYAALAFFHAHRDEVRRMMREDEVYIEQQQAAQTIALQGSGDDAATLSP